jgi:hypothetical protein
MYIHLALIELKSALDPRNAARRLQPTTRQDAASATSQQTSELMLYHALAPILRAHSRIKPLSSKWAWHSPGAASHTSLHCPIKHDHADSLVLRLPSTAVDTGDLHSRSCWMLSADIKNCPSSCLTRGIRGNGPPTLNNAASSLEQPCQEQRSRITLMIQDMSLVSGPHEIPRILLGMQSVY